MGFRRKIKSKIKRLVGMQPTNSTVEVTESPAPTPPPPKAPVAASKEAKPSANLVSEPTPSSKAKSSSDDQKVDPEKVAKHLRRTQKGLLKFLEKQEGTVGLAELHDHSEKRFFIGHKAFSDLMEKMVEEGVVTYDWDRQEASITDQGRKEIGK